MMNIDNRTHKKFAIFCDIWYNNGVRMYLENRILGHTPFLKKLRKVCAE